MRAYNSHMDSNSRRNFLKAATRIGSAGAVVMSAASYSRAYGANSKLNLGVIGLGDRGNHDMELFLNRSDVHVTAICDVFGEHVEKTRTKVPEAKTFVDYRAVVAVSDRGGAVIAGRDVYVEKPLTRWVEEGMPIVKAARENNRICQVGMQQRSAKHYL